MTAIHALNPRAEHLRRGEALDVNIDAAEKLAKLVRTNFGPAGTYKMLVSGAGDIKITKDGSVLLGELPINHPIAAFIATAATAQDDMVGDGTTMLVLLIGELLRQSARWLAEDVHPRVLVDGFEFARTRLLEFMDSYKNPLPDTKEERHRILHAVARSSLGTKVHHRLANTLADIVVDAVEIVEHATMLDEDRRNFIDLHMVEIMCMPSRMDVDTRLVSGLVMDHGSRQSELTCVTLHNCFILTLNVSLEYEKTEINSGFFYKNADEMQKLAHEEREYVDSRCRAIIALKEAAYKSYHERPGCQDTALNFVVLNQKGIDGAALDMLAGAGIFALRRVKRRNMERLTLCCGGSALCSLDDMKIEDLGWADMLHEEMLGEEKYTFVEGVKNPRSCTILVRGPTRHCIEQIKDAVRDGLRAVKNTITDGAYVAGAGAFEAAAATDLDRYQESVSGKAKLGVQAFADALRSVPKALAKSAGYDPQELSISLEEANKSNPSVKHGVGIATGKPCDVDAEGIFDNVCVKHQLFHSATVLTTQLLLTDEVLKAGRSIRTEADGMADTVPEE
ncbi:TCP-1 chaperonin subunit zeta protein [Giardia muris]|uniref:TCP-1 chaperonin subunit zeta protein n=1 Tax=Giardia muris TaxID=5742 RepID=A0A4Z1SV31_GIAMU|nr:TCP-1 chaperonin subunit zeta protein [Giardia muris]|eukprot:TNJ29742.1 TCP-1 chaperonin subunit zeta protein [Giardia muris]